MRTTGRVALAWAVAAMVIGGTSLGAGVADAAPAGPAVDLEETLDGLSFRLVGPFRGGRVTAVAGIPGDPHTFYMGSTGGGVWKTTDGGLTWWNVTDRVRERPEPAEVMGDVDPRLADLGLMRPPMGQYPEPTTVERIRPGDELGSSSIGAIAVAPSDPNVVWVGTGSACIRGNVSPGDGVYRSTDAGGSWRYMGLPEAGQIGRIRIHPTDPDVVWVAALGHAFGSNPERGVYRTVDGGLSWTRVLHVSAEAGAVDLALDPSNPRILYAATWEAVRKPWTMISGGPGSGLWKSTDGGTTWRRLTDGLPEGDWGRVGVAVSPAEPSRVWALIEHADGGLFRSDDGGRSFRLVNSDRELRQRAWYYTHVEADPVDPQTVWVLNVAMWRSDDGGVSFRPVPTPHGDNHALWIDPTQPARMVEGNDGGACVTVNGGRTWTSIMNQPTAEMYRVTVDDREPYWLYGGQQDNSPVAIPSRTPDNGIDVQNWYAPAGCETATVAIDPREPDVTFGGCYGGALGRHDRRLGHEAQVGAWPQLAVGQQAKDLRYRFQWNAPVRISPHDPEVLYHCSNHVHRSTDRGQSWETISPDLTRDDESKQGYAGGPITRDNTGVEVYGTIFAFEPDPREEGTMWAGSDDGLVHLSRDGGATWSEITPAGMPEWGTVNTIDLPAHRPGSAILAVHRYRMDDFTPYAFLTEDFGRSWRRIADGTRGIPPRHFVRVVREDPERPGLLYAGTEFGLYVSLDGGARWQPLQLDLPLSPITDLEVKRDDLVVATQGRSYWILDELGPVRETTPESATADWWLYEPSDPVAWAARHGRGGPGEGKNPPYGAVIRYRLDREMGGDDDPEVSLEILDAAGEVLRSLSSTEPERRAPNPWARFSPVPPEPATLPVEEGLNGWTWDLRLADAEVEPDTVMWGIGRGPTVPPGTYTAHMTVGDDTREHRFEVRADPGIAVTRADLVARYELARDVWEELSRSQRALAAVRAAREQLTSLAERTDDGSLSDRVDELSDRLTTLEERLHQTRAESSQDVLNFPPKLDNQLLALLSTVESAAGRPTAQAEERFEELSAELGEIVAEFRALREGEVARLGADLAAVVPTRLDLPEIDPDGES